VEWDVEFTDEFEMWWNGLTEDEQEDVNAKVMLLQEIGPKLRRPHSGAIASSRHPNMKELIIHSMPEDPTGCFTLLTLAAVRFCLLEAIRQETNAGTKRLSPSLISSMTSMSLP
jgi:hypothetical protein